MVATVANRRRGALLAQRFYPPGPPVELHRLGSRAELLRLDESADRRRVIPHRAHCDCRIRDGPTPCGCMQSCAHFENPFSSKGARIGAVRAGSFRRHSERVPRSWRAKAVIFGSYAREIRRVINSYSQPLARLFLRVFSPQTYTDETKIDGVFILQIRGFQIRFCLSV